MDFEKSFYNEYVRQTPSKHKEFELITFLENNIKSEGLYKVFLSSLDSCFFSHKLSVYRNLKSANGIATADKSDEILSSENADSSYKKWNAYLKKYEDQFEQFFDKQILPQPLIDDVDQGELSSPELQMVLFLAMIKIRISSIKEKCST